MEARRALGSCCAAALVIAGCGGGERQDENEPKGTFRIDVVDAKFPARQKLAKRSDLVITVRNAGDKTVPNIAVTVLGFDERKKDPDLADPNRPVFVVNGVPKRIGGFPESKLAAPEGGETAYVSTWALGPLKRGRTKSFKWSVTAVRGGSYRIRWKVAAGLDGKAKAVDAQGLAPSGSFHGTIDDSAPDTRVADDGKTVIEGTR